MEKKQQNYRPLFFIVILSFLAMAFLIYINLNDSHRTVPKIKLSYFTDTAEMAQSVSKRIPLEIKAQKYFWIGVEPEKMNHIDIAIGLKNEIAKLIGELDYIIIDKELNMSQEQVAKFGSPEIIMLKADWSALADKVKQLSGKKILVVTAAIYSTNLLKRNPYALVLESTHVRPMTFSMGYFPLDTEDEKNNLFKCATEDKTGTAEWGCMVLNKARAVRRQIKIDKLKSNPPLVLGLMDLTGEMDYMILFGK